MRLFKSSRAARPLRLPSARPEIETLESRITPYSASGNAWPSPQLITISFVPDGTVLALGNGGQITSNLFATFNAIPGITSASQWQSIILKAAQSWAAQTNINFAEVSDDGSDAGSGGYQQGASNFGDIRIGGFNFGSGDTWLASTFYPPPANNYSLAGDVTFNTAYSFNIGSTFDLFTVAMHEIGHSLGLGLSSSSSAVMYSTYNGAFAGLGTDDIAGVRSIYSGGNARAADSYDTGSGDNTFATAADITSTINTTSLTAVVNNLDITSTVGSRDTVTSADVDYYKFTAPSGSASTMTVTVQGAGLSLVSPQVTVYASNQTTVLGTATARGTYTGSTLTLSGIAVTPGSTYYVKVQGADTTVFSTGKYALTLNLGTGANPTVPLPNTQDPNGNPLQSGGGTPMFAEPSAPAVLPTGTHSADAPVVNILGSHSTFAPVAVPTPQTGAAAPITTAAVTTPSAVRIETPTSGVVNGVGSTPTEERGEQPAPPNDDAIAPETGDAAPSAVPADEAAAACDAALTVEPEATAATTSADAVAESKADDWTPDGALALASVVFAGTWLRRDAAHKAEEKLAHVLRPSRPKVR